ncbi:hypothetical protein MPSEU_000885600 [Mayamaea pseudoterrestris]|nr:hypothetical protein MPSEU_000885600 [Mayamaea pseudoterrestris]
MQLHRTLLLCLVLSVDSFQNARLARPMRCTSTACSEVLSPSLTPIRRNNVLWMALNNDMGDEQRPQNKLKVLLKRISALPLRLRTRFLSLSKRAQRFLLIPILLLAFASAPIVSQLHSQPIHRPIEIAYSGFMDLAEQQHKSSEAPKIEGLRIGSDRMTYRLNRPADSSQRGMSFPAKKQKEQDTSSYLSAFTRQVSASPELVSFLRKHDISFAAAPAPKTSPVVLAARSLAITFYMLILFRLYKSVGGGAKGGDSPGKLARTSDLPSASFDDIQGMDSVKLEVMELVDTLRNPEKYAILGARAPTGLLLEGPPGTGKTLLARATAASAGVPLLYCSGSDFVEMYVGRGAARVRKLFEKASRLSRISGCIVFIDELDALGKSRDSDLPGTFGRGNDEAEQTLNQLLTCMDGLDSSKRICVLAATNRRQVLDKALVRPGRFDRIVKLKLPDVRGREQILRVHCKKLPGFQEGQGVDPNRLGALGKGRVVDLSAIAALTEGFSGAELEYLVNEAAIRAVRRVSAALREGEAGEITAHVDARDFEESLADFFETRRNNGAMNLLKNVWKTK